MNARAVCQRLGLMLLMVLLAPALARAETAPGLSYFQSGQFAEAFQAWSEAAAAGDARAALYVGVLYDTGLGVQQNYGQALGWYRRAADGDNGTAMFNVGVMYDKGLGTPADPAAAADWYGRAAAKGVGRAEYNLAMLYEAGLGVPRDRNRALELYRAALSHGIAAARLHLGQYGRAYARPVRHAEDPSMRDFERAEQVLLTRGAAAAAEAATLFRRAAERGNPLAAYDLGYCYEHGIGVAPDRSEAIGWYRRAALGANGGPIRTIAEAGERTLETQERQARR